MMEKDVTIITPVLTEYSPDATGRYGLLTCNDNSSTYFAGVSIVGISNITTEN
jgi:hypothetical protein